VKDAGAAFDAVLQPLTTVGGLLSERVASSDRDLSRIKGSLARMDDRLERKEQGFRAQFTRLETALAAAKARESDLSARLGLAE
jgi:flagellar capping protein FliD